MAIFDFLFGSGPEVVKDNEIEQVDVHTPEQKKLLQDLIGSFGDVNNFQPKNLPQGPGTVENLSLAGLDEFIRSSTTGDIAASNEAALATLNRVMETDISDEFNKGVRDPMLKDFEETILPRISRRFASTGDFFGTERVRADSEARDDLLSSLTQTRAQMQSGARDQALRAAGMLPAVSTAGLGQIAGGLEAAGMARAPGDRRSAEAQRQQEQRVAQILQALGVQGVENVAFPAAITGGRDGIIKDLIQGGSNIAAAFAGA